MVYIPVRSRAVSAIELVEKLGLRPPWTFLRRHRGNTLLCYRAMVYRRGRGWCPGRHSLRFTIYRFSRGRGQSLNSRRTASGMLAKCEHAMSISTNSSNSLQSNSFYLIFSTSIFVFLDLVVIWIESNFPRVKTTMFSRDSFFDPSESNTSKYNSIPIQKVDFDQSFFFVTKSMVLSTST